MSSRRYSEEFKAEAVRQVTERGRVKNRCSFEQLYRISQNMGLKKYKGGHISRTNFYRLFRNPFYYGSFLWNGEIYPGNHEPMIDKREFDLAQRIIEDRSIPKAKNHEFAFTGLIHCGECGASITAEEKIKRQKNGNVHRYIYYHCTKRIQKDCSQPYIRSVELEDQILNILSKISIPKQFHEWAIKQLKREHSKEHIDRNKITEAHRHNLDTCTKRLDALFNMRLNEEISADEYMLKKDRLLKEKRKYEELISDTQNRVETWLARAEDLFSFAQKAREMFENGTLEDKRYILSCLGSNLILKDKKLNIQFDKHLALFHDMAPRVQKLHNRLEPAQAIDSTMDWETLYDQNKKWGGQRGSNP